MGTFNGRLGSSVVFEGTIHRTGANSFGMFVGVLGGAVGQVVEGTLSPRPNGALDLKLDRLPALPISNLTLRLWGSGLALIRTPAACGTYTIDGKFTSRQGELAIDRTLMPVTGCAGVPAVQVANVRFSAKRFRAGGSPYGTRTIVAWWASRAVDSHRPANRAARPRCVARTWHPGRDRQRGRQLRPLGRAAPKPRAQARRIRPPGPARRQRAGEARPLPDLALSQPLGRLDHDFGHLVDLLV